MMLFFSKLVPMFIKKTHLIWVVTKMGKPIVRISQHSRLLKSCCYFF